jgi:hypothetical protein
MSLPVTTEVRQAQNLIVIHDLRRLRAWKPRGRRSGLARHHLRMRLPSAIFVLDDGREVLVDRRLRPILERPPGHVTGVPATIPRDEMWARLQWEHYLGNPIDQIPATEEELIDRAEVALRYFGIECGGCSS